MYALLEASARYAWTLVLILRFRVALFDCIFVSFYAHTFPYLVGGRNVDGLELVFSRHAETVLFNC